MAALLTFPLVFWPTIGSIKKISVEQALLDILALATFPGFYYFIPQTEHFTLRLQIEGGGVEKIMENISC